MASYEEPHNLRLEDALKKIKGRTERARNKRDLINAVALLNSFPSPVKYNNDVIQSLYWFGIICCLLTAMIYISNKEPESIIALTIAGGIFVKYLESVRERNKIFGELTKKIHQKNTLYNHGIKPILVDPEDKAEELSKKFSDIHGSHHNGLIPFWAKGLYKGNDCDFKFNQFTHTYNKIIQSDYNTKRYGFIIPFKYAKGIKISQAANTSFPNQFKTSSVPFNETFSVTCSEKFIASKFLVPSIITALLHAATTLDDISLEINNASNLCLSFSSADIIESDPTSNLTTPREFITEIRHKTYLSNFKVCMRLLEEIIKYSDNNFS